jgi:hypothetical protein
MVEETPDKETPETEETPEIEEAPEKIEDVRRAREKPDDYCRHCPMSKLFGACDYLCSFLKDVEVKDFSIHMASARKEVLLGIKSLLDEAIRMEEERIEKKKKAKTKREEKTERLHRIDIE